MEGIYNAFILQELPLSKPRSNGLNSAVSHADNSKQIDINGKNDQLDKDTGSSDQLQSRSSSFSSEYHNRFLLKDKLYLQNVFPRASHSRNSAGK